MSLFRGRRVEERAVDAQAFLRSDDTTVYGPVGERALRLVPVYAAVSMVADSVASLPLQAFRGMPDGRRERARWPLVESPSSSGTLFDWLHRAMVSLLLRGNAFGLVTSFDAAGWPRQVEWLNPDFVTVNDSEFPVLRYAYRGVEVPRDQVVHVTGFSRPGSGVGLSPIANFAATIDMGLGAVNAARDWYKNGSVPNYSLRNTERTIAPDMAQLVKERFRASQRNGEPFVSGSDWELKPIGVSAADARFLEAIKASATQVATIYRIPPEKIGGETGASMTYATTEQQSIDFITHSLMPWMVRLESALSAVMPRPLFVKFNADAMIRTDTITRMQAHEIALRIGLETLDEGRALEDRPPLTPDQVSEWQVNYMGRGSSGPVSSRGADGSGTE